MKPTFLNMKRARFSRVGLVFALAVGLALAGCGNTSNNPVSNGNRMTAEANLTVISTNMTVAFSSNPSSLPQLTQQYIGAVQSSASLLGADVARQKLSSTASLVAPYCGACAQSLNAASAQIGG